MKPSTAEDTRAEGIQAAHRAAPDIPVVDTAAQDNLAAENFPVVGTGYHRDKATRPVADLRELHNLVALLDNSAAEHTLAGHILPEDSPAMASREEAALLADHSTAQ